MAGLFAVSGLGGCTAARPERAAPVARAPFDPDSVVERSFTLQNGWIRGSLMIPAGAGPKSRRAVVINPIVDPERLLERGFVVARYHPHWGALPRPPKADNAVAEKAPGQETVGVWLLASPSPDVIGQAYFRLIWSSGSAAVAVTRYLAELDFVDSGRIGMAGISTNGFKVYAALFAEAPLRAAVIVGSCGDYHSFLRDSPVALDGKHPLRLAPAYQAWLVDREPIRHPEKLVGSSLLLVNGGRDHVIPDECVETTRAAFARAFDAAGSGDRFRQIWLPEATHNELVVRSTDEIVGWWERWLE